MWTDNPLVRKLFAARKDLLRGDSLLAFLIFVVVTIFLVNLAASVWRNTVFEKDLRAQAAVQSARSVGSTLAKAAEVLLEANELSMLRRTIAETGMEHHFTTCRIVLPDGGIVADAEPANITMLALPDNWSGNIPPKEEQYDGDSVRFAFPLYVAGRGSAALEVTAGMGRVLAGQLESQTEQMAIACLALAAMLLVQRHARFRLKAIGAIHDILLSVKDGADVSALELDPQLGSEAVTWNKLLGQRQGLQLRAAIEQVKESIHGTAEAEVDLTRTCDMLPQGLVVIGPDLRTQYANGAAAILLQADRATMTGRDVAEIVTQKQVLDAIRTALSDEAWRGVPIEVEPAEATGGVLRYTVRSIRREGRPCAVVIIEDITQHRAAELARKSFLTKAAHELRTPLTNIRLYVENALENCENNPAATRTCLNVVNEESRRLERSVGEILSVSEIEAGSFGLHYDDVHLDALLDQLKADHQPAAAEKQIALRFDLPPKLPVLHADRDKLALAMHNLLGNALKYTPENGCVTVTPMVEPNQVVIDFADTGIGIGPEDASRIFEKFYRARDERVAKITGSGLGLSIAREIVRLHGGDIQVESELNRGSTFTLTLPLKEETCASEHRDATAGSSDGH